MALTAVEILNTIRDNLSDAYASRVPQATRTNIADVGNAITTDTITMNSFIDALINKVALTNVINRMFTNPLGRLKKAGVPMGNNIEEIFINPATDVGYQKDGNRLLITSAPDGKACYYGLNRQGTYPISITEDELIRAFSSEQAFMTLYNKIVSSMLSGDQIDEFSLMKNMIAKAIDNGAVKILDVEIAKPKEFAKSLSNISKSFTFPNIDYCGYNLVNSLDYSTDEKPCITFCPVENQCLIIRADAQTEINYEFLASLYHMDVAQLETMTVLVDDIPCTDRTVYAVLCDIDAIQVRDMVQKTKTFENGSNLTTNFWYHHWQYLFLSMFGNCVAFAEKVVANAGGAGANG